MDDGNASVCSEPQHFHRRSLLRGMGGSLFLSPLALALARQEEKHKGGVPKSVILLWLEGGPSQLETFDPHPGKKIGGEVRGIETTAKGITISNLLPQVAEQMHRIALVRSVVGKEGDHERAVYTMKTGYRPDPTLNHPSIGAILCHQSASHAEIPRHVSIVPGNWPSRGGYLGASYDAFKIYDPARPIPDVQSWVSPPRFENRLRGLQQIAEREFARGRRQRGSENWQADGATTAAARQMMSSDQLAAFDLAGESAEERARFGQSPFGRGCLAAARLIEVGVRCVEVTLGGWDSHVSNHSLQGAGCAILDAAFAALVHRLAERNLLEKTLVVCGGEFGRTPRINPAEGRDHWPHGFSVALAGAQVRGGSVYGSTNPEPKLDAKEPERDVANPVSIGDLHATMLEALDIPYAHEMLTPVGRPLKIADGKPLLEILDRGHPRES